MILKKLVVSLSALALSLSIASAGDIDPKEFSKLESIPVFAGSGMKITKAYEDGEFILIRAVVQGRMQDLVLTKDKKFLITGRVFNSTTGEALSMPNDISALEGKEALTYGTGKDVYYLFTDPECPYCKKFESYFPQVKNDATFKIFFFPLSFHANAEEMSLFIMSQKTNDEKADKMFNLTVNDEDYINRDIKNKDALKAELQEGIKIGESFGVQGTPALFDANGKSVSWVNVLRTYGVNVE